MTEEEVIENAETIVAEDEGAEDDGVVIQDTDIVFDCPHCGHNLAIDYRGAGLQINCVNCGETVLVPIPDGMKIDDLDIEPGEILKQLFATRRNLQKAELRADTLESRLTEQFELREAAEARQAALQMQLDEMRQYCLQQQTAAEKMLSLIDVMSAPEAEDGVEEASEETAAEEA